MGVSQENVVFLQRGLTDERFGMESVEKKMARKAETDPAARPFVGNLEPQCAHVSDL